MLWFQRTLKYSSLLPFSAQQTIDLSQVSMISAKKNTQL
jgi:hypothetical protein